MTPRFPTILAALALSLTLGACDSSESTPTTEPAATATTQAPAPSPTSEVSALITARVVREGAEVLVARGEEETAVGGGLAVSAETPSTLVIAVPKLEDTTLELGLDGSYAVLEAGKFVLALNRPTSPDLAAQWSWTVHDSADSFLLEATPQVINTEPSPTSPHVQTLIAHSAVESARWVQETEGPRLFITPSAWARSGSALVQQYGWETVASAVPEVHDWDGQSLENQFKCHALGALSKDTWNLETWYGERTLLELINARCNPTS